MSIRKLVSVIFTAVLLAAALCGCAGESEAVETVAPPDYEEVTQLIKTYEDAYRDFAQNGEGQVALVTATGVTPLGAECSSRYTCTSDGVWESCSLTVQRDVEQHDEYFNIGNGIMMFVRSYIDADGFIVINKYYCPNGAVWYINPETHTMDPVEDIEALDCFVTFDQVRRVYGETVDTTETQLPA